MWPFNNQQNSQQPNNQQGGQGQGNNQQNNQQGSQGSNQQDPPKGLDRFAHLLQNANNKDGDGKQGQNQRQPTNVPELFKNQEFLQGLRGNLRQNINSSISAETRQKLQSGDPEALMSLVSEVAEASYLQALQHGASLQNLVMDEKLEDFSSKTNSLVDSKFQNQEFTQAIPQLKNPIVQLGVEAFMSKVREQNPTISPEDMKAQVTDYLSELGKDFGIGKEPEPSKSDTDQGIDWLAELGMEPPPQQ